MAHKLWEIHREASNSDPPLTTNHISDADFFPTPGPTTHPLLRVACTGCTWALEQPLEQTSWVAVVSTRKYWGSQKNGWSPSVQEHGQEAHQCFWVAAKMGETWLKSAVRKTEEQTIQCSVWLEGRMRKKLTRNLEWVTGPRRKFCTHKRA